MDRYTALKRRKGARGQKRERDGGRREAKESGQKREQRQGERAGKEEEQGMRRVLDEARVEEAGN